MSAKINASMKRISASLTLIASKVIAGNYDTIESLKAAQVNVQNAIASTESAFTVATKPATQGRKGIVAMATEAHDQLFANISEAQIKANLLNEALSADIQEMEDNLVEEPTEEIEVEDFSDGGDATQEEDTTVVPEVEEEAMDHVEEAEPAPVTDPVVEDEVVEEIVEEAAAPVADADPVVEDEVVDVPAPEVEEDGGETLDDLIEEEEFEVEGTLDSTLAEFTQSEALDSEAQDSDAVEATESEAELESIDAELEASENKAALKATTVASKASGNNLQAIWDFNSNP